MIITYETLFHLLGSEAGQPELLVSFRPGEVLLSLSTADFKVEYEDGKAKVSLFRNMAASAARELGKALIAATEPVAPLQQYVTVTGVDLRGVSNYDLCGNPIVKPGDK